MKKLKGKWVLWPNEYADIINEEKERIREPRDQESYAVHRGELSDTTKRSAPLYEGIASRVLAVIPEPPPPSEPPSEPPCVQSCSA